MKANYCLYRFLVFSSQLLFIFKAIDFLFFQVNYCLFSRQSLYIDIQQIRSLFIFNERRIGYFRAISELAGRLIGYDPCLRIITY